MDKLSLFGLLVAVTGILGGQLLEGGSVNVLIQLAAFLIVFGSLVTFSAYVWLLQVSSPAIVSTHSYVNPLVAILLGYFLGKRAAQSMLPVSGSTKSWAELSQTAACLPVG